MSTFAVFAQTNQAKDLNISNAEKFTNASGALIKKEFVNIGMIQKCKIEVAYFTDLISQNKTSAVRFEYEYRGTYTTDTKLALLDADEVDGLIKSFKIIIEKILPNKADNYTEIVFTSRSKFTAGCFSKNDSWDTFIKLEAYDSNSYIFMSKDEANNLLALLEQAKTKLAR